MSRHFGHRLSGRARVSLVCGMVLFLGAASWQVARANNFVFTVNSTADTPDATPGDGICGVSNGSCTLRAAIEESNAQSGRDTINFNLPGEGVQTIAPATQLPNISSPVIIDGYSQPGSSANTNSLTQGDNAVILVAINETNTSASDTASGAGLYLATGSDGSTIRGLALGGVAGGTGIIISNSSNNTVAGCFIGTDATGAAGVPNALDGIGIANSSSNNTIGGTTAGARNIISANGSPGVFIEESTTGLTGTIGAVPGTAATGNAVLNNFIGTDATGANTNGTKALGNAGGGVQVYSTASDPAAVTGTTISGNVLSSNGGAGINITGPQTTGTVVQGNFIGTGLNGVNSLPNSGDGVDVVGSSKNTIGGNGQGQSNLISQNKGVGVVLFNGANSNQVTGNLIGTDVTGKFGGPNGNGSNGIAISGANSNVLSQNTISANGTSGNVPGVLVLQGGAGNQILTNRIGTDLTGTSALGNTGSGIQIISTATDTSPITGTLVSGNVISGNTLSGVEIDGPQTSGTVVSNNKIGADATGTVAIPNAYGVQISGASNNTIGVGGAGNVISGNTNAGVAINQGANSNTIAANVIGLNLMGTAALGNGTNGLFISQSGGNTIGGSAQGAANTISGNGTLGGGIPGVVIAQTTSANTVRGNFIGTDPTGAKAFGNSGSGIQITSNVDDSTQTKGNLIDSNVIGGNAGYGVDVDGAQTTGTVLTLNSIGVGGNSSGNPPQLPNKLAGVQVLASGNIIGAAAFAPGNGIGIPVGSKGNTIAYNTGGGVALGGKGNTLRGNSVFGNGNVGVAVSADSNIIQSNSIGSTTGTNEAGTFGSGILVGNGCKGTLIQSNTIGSNAGNGILFYGAAPGHTVGDPLPASGSGSGGATNPVQTSNAGQTNSPLGNFISNNKLAGVSVQLATATACHRKSILGNSIGSNGTLSIDLGGTGTRLTNQPPSNQGDSTVGPNALQNYPVLSGVTISGSNDTITGTLTSAPNATFRIEFYNYEEIFVGFLYVKTNASGVAGFSTVLPRKTFGPGGDSISATATDAVGNTSEFSPAVNGAATTTPVATTTTLTSSLNPSTVGQSVTFTATVAPASGTAKPDGIVTFKDGATTLGMATLNAQGVATLATATLAQGTHSITASYGGSTAFVSSVSNTVTQVANSSSACSTGVINTNNAGTGSLRAAIDCANSNSDASTITFASNVRGTISLNTVLPNLSTPIKVQGPGASVLTVQRSTAADTPGFGIFSVFSGVVNNAPTGPTASISGLTLSNGKLPPDDGSAISSGGIDNSGTLTVTNCILSANSGANGGGIENSGTLTATNCTFSNNSAQSNAGGSGGGIFSAESSTLTVTNCVFSNNTTDNAGIGGGIASQGKLTVTNSTFSANGSAGGGGIVNDGGTANITNSTFSGNTSSDEGGGILNNGLFGRSATLALTNCTLSGNNAGFGGGISNLGSGGSATLTVSNCTLSGNNGTRSSGGIENGNALVMLHNTILNAGTTGANFFNFQGTITSQGYNLSSDGGGGFLTATGDKINTDPKLGALADNGGPTQTLALLAGSPAIDTGNTDLTTDQRGVARPQGAADDIGAFESQGTTPVKTNTTTTLTSSLNPSTVGQSVTFTATTNPASGSVKPSGTVTFKDGTTTLGTGTLNSSGAATFSTATLSVGTHSITAIFGGNVNFGGSTSAALNQIVNAVPVEPTLSINDVRINEGNSGTQNANFTVTLSAASSSAVTVNFATANGTATAGSDYTATSGTLTIPAGQTTGTISVAVQGDTLIESDETFFVNLSAGTVAQGTTKKARALISDAQGVGTIVNDDFTSDLQITQSVAPSPVSLAGQATFSLQVSNNGPGTSQNVVVSDTLPTNATFISASGATFTRSGQVLTFSLGTLAKSDSRTLSVVVRAPNTASNFVNGASVSGTGTPDSNAGNNQSSATGQAVNGPQNVSAQVQISAAKLVRVGAYVPGLYGRGAHFTQKITIRNTSASAISGPLFLVLDGLPANVELVGQSGVTTLAPGGQRYVSVSAGSDGVLSVGEKTTVRLEFRLRGTSRPAFTSRLLAGAGNSLIVNRKKAAETRVSAALFVPIAGWSQIFKCYAQMNLLARLSSE